MVQALGIQTALKTIIFWFGIPRFGTVCMYVCKSLFKHGKSSVKLKLKTETNYNCFT